MENVIIVGSGPAGCTAALYTARARLEPLLLEGALSKDILPGGQLMTTTEIENYPGFPEGVTGPELMQLFKQQAERFGARIVSETVVDAELETRPFVVITDNQHYETKSLIIATGASAKYLGLASEERYLNRGVSACATCDGALPRFRNKPLVVIGGGDTAMEEALFLANFGSKVHVIHRRDALRASKIMAERAMGDERIVFEWNSVVEEVLGNAEDGVTGVRIKHVKTGQIREIACTGYFSAIGHKPNTDLFKDVLDMDETGYLITRPNSTYTNIEGVFAAGDVKDRVYRQAVTAAGSGCMAAIDCARWLESHAHS
jgi:thioredoxin reductase (NADPH)